MKSMVLALLNRCRHLPRSPVMTARRCLSPGKVLSYCFVIIVTTLVIVYYTCLLECPEYTGGVSTRNLINTPGCVIPDIDPFDPSLLKYKIKHPKQLVCSDKEPLTEENGLKLVYYKERASAYGVAASAISCAYQGIQRVEQDPAKYDVDCDNKWKMKDKVTITEKETAINEDAIFVTCIDGISASLAVYEAVHFFIQPWRAEAKRQKFKATFGERKRENLSVIFFGTDSISRGNLQRHMPQTFNFLKNNLQLIDMLGYNKVGENTCPNLSAALIGMYYEELHKACTPENLKTNFDECPFAWKNFSARGYPTVFAEDTPVLGSFNYRKAGFCKQPTDYYIRPYFCASEKLIGDTNGFRDLDNYCQGGKKSISIIHNYSLGVAETLKDIPYFGFYWTSSISHSTLQLCSMADEPTLDYLKKLKDGGYLEHTILMFISDHGARFGEFRQTFAGMMEERLPYAFFSFPKWFKSQYPEAIRNIQINTKRLISSFDLFSTLHDILNKGYANPNARSSNPSLSNRGQSLFREVPENRTCKEAGIPEHFCTCQHSKEVEPSDPHLLEAAERGVEEINKGLTEFPICSPIHLDKVMMGRVGYARDGTLPWNRKLLVTSYAVTFRTQPGGAMMEATLMYNNGRYELSGEVSRINKYGNQSHCISDQVLRKYCFCKDLLQPLQPASTPVPANETLR